MENRIRALLAVFASLAMSFLFAATPAIAIPLIWDSVQYGFVEATTRVAGNGWYGDSDSDEDTGSLTHPPDALPLDLTTHSTDIYGDDSWAHGIVAEDGTLLQGSVTTSVNCWGGYTTADVHGTLRRAFHLEGGTGSVQVAIPFTIEGFTPNDPQNYFPAPTGNWMAGVTGSDLLYGVHEGYLGSFQDVFYWMGTLNLGETYEWFTDLAINVAPARGWYGYMEYGMDLPTDAQVVDAVPESSSFLLLGFGLLGLLFVSRARRSGV